MLYSRGLESRPRVRISLAPPASPACDDSPTKSVKSARLRALRVGEVDWRSARRSSIERISRILSIARFGGGLPRFRSGEGIRQFNEIERIQGVFPGWRDYGSGSAKPSSF